MLLWSSGCGAAAGDATSPEGSAGDFDALCHAEARSGAIGTFPFSDKATQLNGWIERNVNDPAVKQLYFETMPQILSTDQGPMLRREAAEHGVDPCPLADYVAFTVGMSYEASNAEDCVAACRKRNEGAIVDLERICSSGCGGDL
jgi:hypothetical protein